MVLTWSLMRSELFGDVAGLPPHPAAADENIGVNEPDHIGDPKLASNSCGMATVSARIPAARIPRPNRRQRSPSHCGDAGKLGVPADCATVHSTFWGGIEGRERARARGKCPLPHLWERHEVKRGGERGRHPTVLWTHSLSPAVLFPPLSAHGHRGRQKRVRRCGRCSDSLGDTLSACAERGRISGETREKGDAEKGRRCSRRSKGPWCPPP